MPRLCRKSKQEGAEMEILEAQREQWWGYRISMSAWMWAGRVDAHLHGSHIVESVVQLLADGFVLQFLSVQLVYDQEVEGRGARTWRVIKRWKVSEGGTGAIPTQQQEKGNAWRKWCRSRWPMQEACVLFLNELKQKQKEQNPLENKTRKTQYENHNKYGRYISKPRLALNKTTEGCLLRE